MGKALRTLQEEGLIYRVPGLGYYAAEPDWRTAQRLSSADAAPWKAVRGRPTLASVNTERYHVRP